MKHKFAHAFGIASLITQHPLRKIHAAPPTLSRLLVPLWSMICLRQMAGLGREYHMRSENKAKLTGLPRNWTCDPDLISSREQLARHKHGGGSFILSAKKAHCICPNETLVDKSHNVYLKLFKTKETLNAIVQGRLCLSSSAESVTSFPKNISCGPTWDYKWLWQWRSEVSSSKNSDLGTMAFPFDFSQVKKPWANNYTQEFSLIIYWVQFIPPHFSLSASDPSPGEWAGRGALRGSLLPSPGKSQVSFQQLVLSC